MANKIIGQLVLGFMMVGLLGCGPQQQGKASIRRPYYEWVASLPDINPKSPGLDDVNIVYTSNGTVDNPYFGVLPWGTAASWGMGLDPIPETATIRWKEVSDIDTPPFKVKSSEHSQEVEIAKLIPDLKNWSGQFFFVYLNGKWKVIPWGKDDDEKLMQQGKFKELGHPPIDRSLLDEATTQPTTQPTTRPAKNDISSNPK